MEINYSFIIPHKNSFELLKRCVDSIPIRDDIQIIIVDDNSDDGNKPVINRPNIEIIMLDKAHSKGAGRARNVGLEYAKGKWILFADADDYYNDGFVDILDAYKESNIDVVYFNASFLDRRGKEVEGGVRLNKIIANFDNSQESMDLIKYRIHVPWNKMVKKKYVDAYGFQFEEIPSGNDTMFSYQIGYFAKNIYVLPEKLYVYTINPNSITHNRYTSNKCLLILCNIRKNIAFYNYIGHREWGKEGNVKSMITKMLKRLQLFDAILFIHTYFTNKRNINNVQNQYVDLIEAQLKKKNI